MADAHVDTFSTITLRVARCFPEDWRSTVVNRLYRGLDIRDVVAGLQAAVEPDLPAHRILNVAGPRVFERGDVQQLCHDAPSLLRDKLPSLVAEFATRRWALPDSIDRLYVSDLAGLAIGWNPTHGVRSALSTNPGTT